MGLPVLLNCHKGLYADMSRVRGGGVVYRDVCFD